MKRINERVRAGLDRAMTSECRYGNDIERILDVAAGIGVQITPAEAEFIWSRWSAGVAAGWLMISDDQEIVAAINSVAIDEEDE